MVHAAGAVTMWPLSTAWGRKRLASRTATAFNHANEARREPGIHLTRRTSKGCSASKSFAPGEVSVTTRDAKLGVCRITRWRRS